MANPVINVSQLDFAQIKQNLKDFLRQKPELQDYDFEGSGWAYLIDILAYYQAYNAFYLNMVASEMFLDSAQLRDSVLARAKMLGYLPKSKKSSNATLLLRMGPDSQSGNEIPATIQIPKEAKFVGYNTDSTKFEFVITEPKTLYLNNPDGTDSDFHDVQTATFPHGYFEIEVVVHEGALLTHRFPVTSDTGAKFVIPNQGIDINLMTVTVQESDTNQARTLYNRATDITELTSASKAYYIQQTAGDLYEIYFGDDVLSASVKAGNIVIVEYIVCNGAAANGIKEFSSASAFYMLPDSYNQHTNHFVDVIETVSDSTGGEDEESLKSIKTTAPINFEMQNRAVTKLDFEQIVQRYYPRIDSITVWGGEDNDPAEYGRVFLCIKPAAGYVLDNTDKDIIIDDIIKPRCTLTQEPVIVDPDYVNLVVRTDVKFNFRLTTKTKQEIQYLVYNSILNFNETNLEKFQRGFIYSDFVEMIDLLDPSIHSNLTTIRLKKTITPTLELKETYSLKFQNALDVYDNRNSYGKAIYSSMFYYVDPVTSCFFAEDSFKSDILSLFKIDPYTNDLIRIAEMGTIDHANGKIEITEPFVPASWINKYAKIDFFAKPVLNDISSARDMLLVIDPVDIFVTAKEVSN
jgi:hypothetical protein